MINGLRDEKDKEWIRRRQMRLVQVRKQSNDIAKQLRARVNNEERDRRIKKENEVEMKLELWKIKQLKDLEEIYRNAIKDIGTAHKLAVEEPEANVITEEKQKVYLCKAKERGETAMGQALREKREATEKKLIPIQRKIITRQMENLRSSLVSSIPPRKQSLPRNVSAKKVFNPILFESNYEDDKLSCRKLSCLENRAEKSEKKAILSSSEDHIQNGMQKLGNKMTKKSKRRPDSPCKAKDKTDINSIRSFNVSCPEGEKFWISLGAIEAITEEDDEADKKIELEEVNEARVERGRECQKKKESNGKNMKNGVSKKKVLSEKEGEQHDVACYGYSVRHKCKLKSDVSSVRKVNQSEPDPVELARLEQEQLEQEKTEKENRMMTAEERGCKAIEKEKIKRNYNELLAKLEKLNTKEKLIKTYCHIPPPHMFMSDERRQEKSVRKQRIMDSKFEKIYYETMGINSESDSGKELNATKRIHENEDKEENCPTKLDLGRDVEWNLKTNSPDSISSRGCEREEKCSQRDALPVEKVSIKKTPSSLHFKRTKIRKGGEIFLSDIDRLLKKTRKLRQDSYRSSEHPPSECKLVAALSDRHLKKAEEKKNLETEESNNPSVVSDSSELGKSISLSPSEGPCASEIPSVTRKMESKESNEPKKGSFIDLGMGDLGRDFSGIRTNTIVWPVHQVTTNADASDEMCARSSTTSYRGLPSRILPKRINSLLKLLVQLKEREGKSLVGDELIVKMEETLDSLIREAERSNVTLDSEECHEFQFNPQLNYYITKLLSMSRERIANLSVSSESCVSMQKVEDGASCGSAGKTKAKAMPENKYLKQMNKSSKCSNLKRERELERIFEKWKRILEKNLKKCPHSGENCDDSPLLPEDASCYVDEVTPRQSSSFFDKYEEVSKKCSACISELSNVLAGIRKEVARDGEYSGDEDGGCGVNESSPLSGRQCDTVPKPECSRSRSLKKREAADSCKRSCPPRSTTGDDCNRQGSECRPSADESMESLPNVMEVLLNKGLISSPFHWNSPESQGSHCSGCCELAKPDRIVFLCRPSCRGACNSNFQGNAASEAGKSKAAPVDPEALRALRKKLEKIPMKYIDPRFGVYSPTPVPRPIPMTPPDPDFMKKNFGQPLFGLPVNQPDAESRRPRQLYFKVAREERPSSEPRICDRTYISGSESDRQSSAEGTQKRPRSSPSKRLHSDTYKIRSGYDSVEDNPIRSDTTYARDTRYVSDEACFRPASSLINGGVTNDSSGAFTSHQFFEAGSCPDEQRTYVRSPAVSSASSHAVHCRGNKQGSFACDRRCPSGGRDRVGGTRSPDVTGGPISDLPCGLNGRYSFGTRYGEGSPYKGVAFDEEEDCDNSEGRFDLDWAEDFLEGLPGDD